MTLRTRLMASAALLAAQPVTAAFAQDDMLGTLVLGESRRGIQTDTATPETILQQDELDARQAGTLAQLLDTVPGVTLVNGATPQGSAINIRGFGAQAGTYGSDGKVSVVIDGVAKGQEEIYRAGGLLTMEPELFREVTVTRGPAESFRYSSGAMGGTVEAETKDAADFLEVGDTFALRQKLSYQSNGEGFQSSTILAWAPDDRFDLIAFAGYREVEDYRDGDGNVAAQTSFALPAALIKAKYRASDALTITGSVSYTENDEQDVNYDAYFGPTFFANVDRYTTDTTAYLAFDYNPVGNDLLNLTAKLTYSDEVIELNSATTSSDIYNADHRTKRLALLVENEALFATGAVEHALTTGIEVGRRTRSSLTDTGTNSVSAPGGTDDYVAAYVTDRMQIGNLTLTPQLRYEAQVLTSRDNPAPAPADGTEFRMSALTGALSARYGFASGFSVFGTVAYNENLPPLDDLYTPMDPSNPIERSEKGVTVEAGLGYDGFDVLTAGDGLKAKLTAFNTRVWDGTTYSGIDEVDLKGAEFELSYVHPAFYADLNASMIRGTVNGSDDYFNYAPADKLQLTLGKRFMDEQLDLSLETRHSFANDRTTTATAGSATSPSEAYTTFTLSAAYTPNAGWAEGIEFRGAIENVFDTAYTPYLSTRAAPGRTIKLSVAKVF